MATTKKNRPPQHPSVPSIQDGPKAKCAQLHHPTRIETLTFALCVPNYLQARDECKQFYHQTMGPPRISFILLENQLRGFETQAGMHYHLYTVAF
jgi:hypothetical protein